jgi:hypothetical protein
MGNWIVPPSLEQAAKEEREEQRKAKQRKSHRVEYDIDKTPRTQIVRINTASKWNGYSRGYIHNMLWKQERDGVLRYPPSRPRKKPTEHRSWWAGDLQDFERAGHSMEEWARLREALTVST